MSKAFRDSPGATTKMQRLQQATSVSDLQRAVRETGIRWYLVHPAILISG